MLCCRPLIATLSAFLTLAVPNAEAYEFPPVDDEVSARVEACVDRAIYQNSDSSACIGAIFDACEGNAGTTYSMSACFSQEQEFWQSMIARTFEALSEKYRTTDRRSVMDEPLSESLAKAQTAWNAYAEAECRFAYDKIGTGSFRHIEAGACKRNLAAERAIFLRTLSAED
jgi:uncharacterized protein YecT (DUF1311 family)